MKLIRKSQFKIVYEPKECDPNCVVHDCHYIHVDFYAVYKGDNFIKRFSDELEADNYIEDLITASLHD